MKRVLVISPHPDDEAIGCGGTIRAHVHQGDQVHVIFLTSGEKGGHGRNEEETRRVREEEAIQAGIILGTVSTEFWRMPDGDFTLTEEAISRMVEKSKTFGPDIIYIPHEEEAHPDHKSVGAMVKQAYRNIRVGINIPQVWMYEVWTPLQSFDHVVDISNHVPVKRDAIRAHKSQCDVMDFDDAILGLNRYRGEMHSWPGGDFAEVFKNLKLDN